MFSFEMVQNIQSTNFKSSYYQQIMTSKPVADNGKQISMAASAIALRGVRIFLTAGRHAAERTQAQGATPVPRPKPKGKKTVVGHKLAQKVMEVLMKTTRFTK